MEVLFDGGKNNLRDISSVYESLFLRAIVGLEQYLENLFVAILSGSIIYSPRKIICKMSCESGDALREILLQGQNYLDWLPYNRTEDRATLYLANRGTTEDCGRPFVELDDGEKSQLKTMVTIRNAIAHTSSHAMNEFLRKVVGSQALLPREKKPAGYLRSLVTVTPRQTRMEAYMGKLGSIAVKILGRPLNRA